MENSTEINAVIDRAKTQLVEFYNGNNWVTDNFSKRILSLKQNDALMKMQGSNHSVAELVGHMIAWRNFAVQKLTGNDNYDIEDESKENWNDQNDWNSLCREFELCHQNLLTAIDNFPLDNWNAKVPGRNYSFLYLIYGIIQHDYYHYGQIGSVLAAISKMPQIK